MDDMDGDPRYHPKPYSSGRRKIHTRNTQYSRPVRYAEEDDDVLDEFNPGNGREYHQLVEDDDDGGVHENFERHHHPKKRRLKDFDTGGYEFAPRVRLPYPGPPRGPGSGSGPGPGPGPGPSSRGSGGGGAGEADWTEHAVFVLLEVWGDRFLQLGRKSLRSEDWHEVAEKVSEGSKIERTDVQCRSMLDMLKKKYKKEKAKFEEMGMNSSKWAYFKKMDMLMASSLRQECGLACGVDSGEYVFMNTRVYLERSNGFDEMRDSPGESEAEDDEEEEEDGGDGFGVFSGGGEDGSSYRVLTDSINKFGEIYEKIENSKRQQMRELEKMRKNFDKELELQKKQILERAEQEIAKIQEADDGDGDGDGDGEATDVSAEDLSE